jgi:hypothetical protein
MLTSSGFTQPVTSRTDSLIPINVARVPLAFGATAYAGFSRFQAVEVALRHGKNL